MSDVSQANLGLATSRDRTRRYRARLKRGHGKDIREKPLLERKKILKALMPRDPLLRYSDHVAEFDTINKSSGGSVLTVDYNFPKPGTTEPVPKQSFVTKVGNQGCGVGADFVDLFKIMGGLPVTIRLLDAANAIGGSGTFLRVIATSSRYSRASPPSRAPSHASGA
jgi:hypothetical protein